MPLSDSPLHSVCIAPVGDLCGEGVVWDAEHNAIYWTDINRGHLHRYEGNGGKIATWHFDQPVTAIALTTRKNTLLVVLGGKVLLWNPEIDDRTEVLYRLEAWPQVRCNDARVDPTGVLWFGTMQNNVAQDQSMTEITQALGELFSLDASGQLTLWDGGIGVSNTLAWSPQADVFYFADTLANTIYAYDYDISLKSISRRRNFSSGFMRGLPDGSAMDAEGYLWNCRFGGSCIVRFAPDGSVARIIETSVRNPTTCAFGGANMSTLYYTSAALGDINENIEKGGLFAIEVGARGLPLTPFAVKA